VIAAGIKLFLNLSLHPEGRSKNYTPLW